MTMYKVEFVYEYGIQTFWVDAEDPEMAESVVDMTLGELVDIDVEEE
tara:strand:+ start:279 stop:419 length:141 start_codon:yes stop_codon:yes gene_type:complete